MPEATRKTYLEEAIKRGEGSLNIHGAFVANTTPYTGRSADRKYTVSHKHINDIAFNDKNKPCSPKDFDNLWKHAGEHLLRRSKTYFQHLYAGANPAYMLPIHITTENAWHALFSYNMLIRSAPEGIKPNQTPIHILHAPSFDAAFDGDRRFIGMDMESRRILITGTGYAGEIKKSVFSYMNGWLPRLGVFTMHCAANVGRNSDVALFFGLSGTGKTALSAVGERNLIGDDEHGWGQDGVFNFEGGCYAKVLKITHETEPEIFKAACSSGTILENVMHGNKIPDFFNKDITENGRASYPLDILPNVARSGMAGHPENIFLLSCDVFGVLPPLSKLTPEQAAYLFLQGYSADAAGTQLGKGGSEPKVTFSSGFGEVFLPLRASVYADMFRDKLREHKPNCWLINTGYTGKGERMPISLTRRLVEAALSGELKNVKYTCNNPFGLMTPESVPHVRPEELDIRQTWGPNGERAYNETAKRVAELFGNNFREKHHDASKDIAEVARNFGYRRVIQRRSLSM